MHLTKLSLTLLRIAITLATSYILFSYGITQSLVTLGHIGNMSGWKLFTAIMMAVVYWGVGQVIKELEGNTYANKTQASKRAAKQGKSRKIGA